jgi:DNA-binding transcriptional regulator YiaG
MVEKMDLQALRRRVGLTQEGVSKHLDLSGSTVRNWENGRTIPTLSPVQWVELLKLYRCTPEEFADAFKATERA